MESKRRTGISVSYQRDAGTITWTDTSGAAEPLVLKVDGLSEQLREAAMWHGLDQRVTDAGAMGMDHWDGKDKPKRYATIAERLGRMRRVAASLEAGEWRLKGEPADPLAALSAEQLRELEVRVQAKLAALIAG